jgi:hypothetical protein
MESVLKIFMYNFHNKACRYIFTAHSGQIVGLNSVHMQVQVTMKQAKQRKNAKENKKREMISQANQREVDDNHRGEHEDRRW